MLMHEWIKFRNAEVKRAAERRHDVEEAPEAGEEAEAEEQAAAEAEPAQAPEPPPEAPQAEADAAENNNREKEALIESLHQELVESGRSMRGRLEALHGRQQQLPIDLEQAEAPPSDDGSRNAVETREDLVRRLLDPTLTLQEAALLLDVCPATVRRYTNRGLLNCFRTPGNQRRFRLSHILDFIEQRERDNQ